MLQNAVASQSMFENLSLATPITAVGMFVGGNAFTTRHSQLDLTFKKKKTS